MNRSVVIAVIVSAALLAGLRLAGEKSQAFQAAAHLEVGALLGWAIIRRTEGAWWFKFWTWARFPALVALALSLIELAAFFFLPR